MRLIDNHKIPVSSENFFILCKLTADNFRAAQILNTREIYKIICRFNQTFDIFRITRIIFIIAENFLKILQPTFFYNRAMSDNNSFRKIHALDDFQRTKSFSKSHFRIPQKIFIGTKFFNSHAYSLFLFRSENYRNKNIFTVSRYNIFMLFNCANCGNSFIQRNFKPFATG